MVAGPPGVTARSGRVPTSRPFTTRQGPRTLDGPSADGVDMASVPTHYRCPNCATIWLYDSATVTCPRCLHGTGDPVHADTARLACRPCQVTWAPAFPDGSSCWSCGTQGAVADPVAGAWEYTDPAAWFTHAAPVLAA